MITDASYFIIPFAVGAWFGRKGKPFVAVLIIAILSALAPRQAWWALGVKRPIPVDDFEMNEVQGGPRFRLSEDRGRPIVLFLWATWCPHTGEYMPLMRSLSEKFQSSHVRFAVVDYEEVGRPALLDYIKTNNMAFPVYDGWHAYFPLWNFVTFRPTVLFIDRQGRLNDVFYGTTQEEVEKKIRDIAFDGSPESRMPLAELLRRNGVAVPAPETAATQDGREAWDAEGRRAEALLLAGRLDELESKAAEYRAARARFSDGIYRLGQFYEGLAIGNWRKDEEPDPFPDRVRALEAWAAAKPASITARVALVKAFYYWAWRARGSDPGVKDKVNFEQRLARGHEEAEKALALPEKDPELFRARLALGKGLGLERAEMEKLLAEATAFDPSYERFYQSMADYLSPRWYGQPGDWETFAQQSAELRRDPALYALIIGGDSDFYEDDLFKNTSVAWPRLRDGLLEVQKRYPDSLYLRSRFARYACEAGDKETGRPLMAALGGRYDSEAWSPWNGRDRFERCTAWADGSLAEATLALRRLIK